METAAIHEALKRMRTRDFRLAEVELRDLLRKAETAAFTRAMRELGRSLHPQGPLAQRPTRRG